jgi:hypothetical protein
VRQSLYAFAGLATLTMTAPSAAAGDISGEPASIPTAPSYEGPSLPQGDPQGMLSLLAVRRAAIASSSDENADITELQFTWSIADDW